jgi:anthranilate 1,2-dioxygenase large subunit
VAHDVVAAQGGAVSIDWPAEDNRIPREVYIDPHVYRVEMERVFKGRVWILVGHESEIPEPGDYKTIDVGEIPLIVVRSKSGNINALVNACAHRGARLVDHACGNVRTGFRCIYHMWNYDTDGNLLGVSLPDTFPEEFKKEDYGLPRARVASYRGAIFVSFNDDAPNLDDYLGELKEGLDLALGDGELRYLGAIKSIFHTNWKLYVENIYDGYHVTALHTGFQLVKLRSQGGERFAPGLMHLWGQSRGGVPERHVLKDMSILETTTKEDALNNMMVLFPTGVATDYFDAIHMRYVIPRGPDKTEVHFAFFARKSDSEETVARRLRQAPQIFGPEGSITHEDTAALERVQLSAVTRTENVVLKGTPKRFPPYRHIDEAPIRHFYQSYRRLLES